eukprot:432494-Prymnesium_polylepis.1
MPPMRRTSSLRRVAFASARQIGPRRDSPPRRSATRKASTRPRRHAPQHGRQRTGGRSGTSRCPRRHATYRRGHRDARGGAGDSPTVAASHRAPALALRAAPPPRPPSPLRRVQRVRTPRALSQVVAAGATALALEHGEPYGRGGRGAPAAGQQPASCREPARTGRSRRDGADGPVSDSIAGARCGGRRRPLDAGTVARWRRAA